MRTLALLLLIPAGLLAQTNLSPVDETTIRTVIAAEASKDAPKPNGQVLTELGPFVYTVNRLEGVVPGVALAEVEGVVTGSIPGLAQPYLFILAETDGRWTIVRKIDLRCRAGFKGPSVGAAAAPPL